ncbi:pseudouridine synthase [Sebaldella sp. S0638]|uniref:pseudouridine synthase n=1 Tax=Sebaldella sp. S0638 TaxID=2957809 RepID=UPI0020A08D57|nr:pseudouridine synthase [Sebaldella sp. S0638]MCP1223425.1 rRNA pseudouridine synthase [Sebaldella sp. S0638]
MRIDKLLANSGIGTRKEVKELLKKKRISVNGEIITEAKMHIDEDNDIVTFDGERIEYKEFLYIMLNKPQDVISATDDERHRTVLDLLEESLTKVGLFPVGRLDKDTEGLLVLTNDGKMAHELLSPKKHVPKRYYVELKKPLSEEEARILENGVELETFTTKPAKIEFITEDKVYIIISEGKYHQVKRMFKCVGNRVLYLKRVSMGNLELDESLELGEYRELTPDELELLQSLK